MSRDEGAAFAIGPGPDGPRYSGPHGPIDIPPDQPPDRTVVRWPAGEAWLDWSMRRNDRDALRAGVAASIGGRSLRLRREGRTLVLEEDGTIRALLRQRRGGFQVEGPDGTRVAVATWSLKGRVEPVAAPGDVVLLVLAAVSGVTRTLDRRLPLPLFP